MCRHNGEFVDGAGRCIVCTPPGFDMRGRDQPVAVTREWHQSIQSTTAGAVDRTAGLFEQLRAELAGRDRLP